MRNIKSQRAHDVYTRAVLEVQPDERWECSSKDGYMCTCRRERGRLSTVATKSITVRRRPKSQARLPWAESSGADDASFSATAPATLGLEPTDCPATDLEVPEQLEAMLRARASPRRDIAITILGPTSGMRAVQMGEQGKQMLLNMISNLRHWGVGNYLAITTHLYQPSHPGNNLCLSALKPAGVCCAYSGVGMPLVAEGSPGRRWGITETHPYLLFLQRWWFTGQAVGRGYNVLSLDTDMHLEVNPFEQLRRPPFDTFSAIMQLDSAWPVEGRREGQRSTDERGQHVNVLPCRNQDAVSESTAMHGCPCGVTPAPMLNTGFVYVRASAASMSAQQLVYNRSVELILERFKQPPKLMTDSRKEAVDPRPVWAQDVVNEVATSWASLPSDWPASCHIKDTACQQKLRKLSPTDVAHARRRWWLTPCSQSLWMASHASLKCDSQQDKLDDQLVAWTELRPPQLVGPTATLKAAPTLAALPRVEVGRMCGKRQQVDTRWLTWAPPLSCSLLASSPLRQKVLHMQFTHVDTRIHILKAMHWWYLDETNMGSGGNGTGTTCAAIASGQGPASMLPGAVISSAMASMTLLCLLPNVGEASTPMLIRGDCPCCWDVDQLRQAMDNAIAKTGNSSPELASGISHLKKAERHKGCRIWRRYE